MNHLVTCIVMLLIAGTNAPAVAADDPIFDVQALISTPLNPRTLKKSERDGVITEEVMIHSERDGACVSRCSMLLIVVSNDRPPMTAA